jgi:peptidoglycan/LPS O-acetylase OafA/YrhL
VLVVLGHAFTHGVASPPLKALAPLFSAELGVVIFFVISGYLITTLLADEMDRDVASLPRFYARRFVRLAPAQLVFIGALFLLTGVTPLRLSACQFATALTYTKNYACRGWVDAHLWSLSVEEQFYLLWPAALVFLPRCWAVRFAVLLLLLAPVTRAAEYHLGHRAYYWLLANTDALMVGCLAALYANSAAVSRLIAWRPGIGRFFAALLALVPVLLGRSQMFGAADVLMGQTVQALAAAYLILSFTKVREGLTYRLLNTTPMRALGVISYSVYLWQQLFFATPADFGGLSSPLLVFPLNVLAVLAMAALSYTLVERPLLSLRRILAARPAPQFPWPYPLVRSF